MRLFRVVLCLFFGSIGSSLYNCIKFSIPEYSVSLSTIDRFRTFTYRY